MTEFRLRPAGSDPEAKIQWYGGWPPIAANDDEYGFAVLPAGMLPVMILNARLMSVAVALERAEGSAVLVAVMVTFLSDVPVGAVHKPLGEIVPPLANQLTAVSAVFLTNAEN